VSWVPDMAAKRAEISADRVAFRDHETGRVGSFAEVNDRANRLAHALAAKGATAGDRIAILCLNRPDFFTFLFACQKGGFLLVPLNWRQPHAELAPIVVQAAPRIIAFDADFAECGGALAGAAIGTLAMDDLDDLLAASPDGPVGDGRVRTDAPWYLLFTSGTTGRPKAVIQTAAMAWANTVNFSHAVDLVSSDRSVNFLPLFHTAGINLLTLPLFLAGGESVFMRRFDVDAMLDLIQKDAISILFGVPAIYQAMALSPRFAGARLDAVRTFACGGAPLPEPLVRTFAERGVVIRNGMGMTETGPTLFLMAADHAAEKPGAVGKAPILTEVRIVAASGAPITGPGEGELQVRGPAITPGYWNDSAATQAAFALGDWLKTGDIARRDAEGFYAIVDRIKDMYISGGENIYPAEVEQVLAGHEDVLEAVVLGIPDAKWGEAGEAFLLPREKREIDVEALPAWCRERLAGYKVPKRFHIVSDFPRTAAGKVQKHLLRAGQKGGG